MSTCTPICWTRVRCDTHGIDMPPAGRSAPDDMPTCDHQHTTANTRHLWDQHDSTRWYTDPKGWAAHVAQCDDCRPDTEEEA